MNLHSDKYAPIGCFQDNQITKRHFRNGNDEAILILILLFTQSDQDETELSSLKTYLSSKMIAVNEFAK